MSSDFVAFENPIAMFHSDTLFLSDSSIDSFLHEFPEEPQSLEEFPQTLISNSSIDQMQSLSLFQQTQFPNVFIDCPVSGVKLEESQFQLGFDSPPSSNAYFSGSESYGGDSSIVGFLQRSCSDGSHSYDGWKQGTLFQPPFENSFPNEPFEGHLRRVFSTGDLPKKTTQRMCSSVLGSQSSSTTSTFMEEASFKVGKYSPEERKERIDRYRAKRGLRNFNKTIKYACRKTLADNRPRVRGRFARNDEPVEMATLASSFNRYEHEDDLWVGRLNERDEGIIHGGGGDQGGQFVNHFGGSYQFDNGFIGY